MGKSKTRQSFEHIIVASQGNFEHLSMQLKLFAKTFNKLAQDFKNLEERPVLNHTHDATTGEVN